MSNPAEKPEARREGEHPLKLIGQGLWHMLQHNWGFKLLALVLALALWAGLITQDPTLTREKRFDNVTISVIGTDTMKRNGFVVISDLNELLSGAMLRADVPQNHYSDAQASNYNARIDLSRISQIGEQEVRVMTSPSTSYGSVQEVSPSTVTVMVDEYITRSRIPINVETQGELPDGFESSGQTIDPSMLTVSGPKSIVDTIVRAEAVMDKSILEPRAGEMSNSIHFRLVNAAGEEVPTDLLEVTTNGVLVDSIIVQQTLYPTKALALVDAGIVIGTPAAGYEIKSISFTPETVVAAGKTEALDVLDQVFANATVDVTDRSETFYETISVRKPSELQSLNPSSVTVLVEIGPVIRSRTFENIRYTTVGLQEGTSASLETKTGSVTVTGPQLWVESLRTSQVKLSCNVEGLGIGSHEAPVLCEIDGSEDVVYSVEAAPQVVGVTIKEK